MNAIRVKPTFAIRFLACVAMSVSGCVTWPAVAEPAAVPDVSQDAPRSETSEPDRTATQPQDRDGGRRAEPQEAFFPAPEGVWPVASVILARPGATTIEVSVLAAQDLRGRVEYGRAGTDDVGRTAEQEFKAGEPVVVRLSGLTRDTAYSYRLVYAASTPGDLQRSPEYRFCTQRPPGSTFTFTVQADRDTWTTARTRPCTPARCAMPWRTSPTFTSISATLSWWTSTARTTARQQDSISVQRSYFGLLCHSAPLFLVLGNHDGEGRGRGGRNADGMATWSNQMRRKYFPNPIPGEIYSGSEARQESGGSLENYYAWEWGDALFIVLDPYGYTTRPSPRADDGWAWTLGETQYRWLQRTLEDSRARFKFVFIHHLVGGGDGNARGGVEVAKYFEWGGLSRDGSPDFTAQRPGWAKPIHELLRDAHVAVVFHGHDHFFAKQELDGVVYQLVPQPGHPCPNATRLAEEYSYSNGKIVNGSGYLRVTVSAPKVTVDFRRTLAAQGLPKPSAGTERGYSYQLEAARPR